MKKYLLILGVLFSLNAHSQRLSTDIYGGIANYPGDLQGRVTLDNAHFAGGIGLAYTISPRLVARTGFTMGFLSGSDLTNYNAIGVDYRNLNFETALKEFHLALEISILNMEEHSISPYFFGGAAVIHFNPYTRDANNNKVNLQPLGTEGQGIPDYPSKQKYNLTQLVIPFGGGLKFTLSDYVQVSVEIGMRKLFTDYLDDVSGNYADSTLLANYSGPVAVAFAYRGAELHGAPPYPAAGSQRGNPKNMDSYYITCFRIWYLLHKNEGNGRPGSRVGCPVNVF